MRRSIQIEDGPLCPGGRGERPRRTPAVVTGAVCDAISPAGHRGRRGELWYARVLPQLIPAVPSTSSRHLHDAVHRAGAGAERVAGVLSPHFTRGSNSACLDANARRMNHGPTRNDFVFEAYVNHRSEVIYLAGLPSPARGGNSGPEEARE